MWNLKDEEDPTEVNLGERRSTVEEAAVEAVEEEEEEVVTLDEQFVLFAKLLFDTEETRDGSTMTLYRSDYWMRQAKILDDKRVTMTDTGILWFRNNKTELNYHEWCEFLTELCRYKHLDKTYVEEVLCKCGIPGFHPVVVPEYKEFFDKYKPRAKLLFVPD